MSRTLPVLAGLAFAVALSACSSDNGGGGPSTPATITAAPGGAAVFSPTTITINAGESVRFVWAAGATTHNVSPATGNPSALPQSPGFPTLIDAPQDFSVVFPTSGIFNFYCTAHGANPSAGSVSGMSGTITVN